MRNINSRIAKLEKQHDVGEEKTHILLINPCLSSDERSQLEAKIKESNYEDFEPTPLNGGFSKKYINLTLKSNKI
jgi:hypothetical protein